MLINYDQALADRLAAGEEYITAEDYAKILVSEDPALDYEKVLALVWADIRKPASAVEVPDDFPSLTEQMKSFSGALVDFVATGFETVTKEDYKRRIEICNSCEMYTHKRCLLCGCYMPAKAWIPAQICKKGSW